MNNNNKFSSGNVRNRQQAQGAREAQAQKGAVNSHGIEGGENLVVAKTSRKRNIDPMQAICRLSRAMFDRLPRVLQTLETKQSCISTVVDRHNDKVGDLGDFYGWLLKRAAEILRTYDFKPVCEAAGLKTDEEQQAVSEHLVLEPKSIINKIRMEGLVTY